MFACGPGGPSQHDPARYGNVRVGVSAQLNDPNRLIDTALNQLDVLGPDFIRVSDSDFHSIVIAPEPSVAPDPGQPCRVSLRYEIDTKTIYVDQQCMTLPSQYQDEVAAGFMQLIAQIVGMQPICRTEQTNPNCSSVGKGPALMNMYTSRTVTLPTTGTFTVPFDVLHPSITELDLAEYRLHGHPL